MSPYRNQHSCMINDKVTLVEEVREKKTAFGVLGFVYGRLHKGGALVLRSIRFPGEVSVSTAQSLCAARGGQFSPATPINPQHQMLSGYDKCVKSRKREILEALISDFEMPFDEVILADWPRSLVNELPDSSFAIVLSGGVLDEDGRTVPRSHRLLPYKTERGTVDASHLRNALATVHTVKASANLKLDALTKLLRAVKSIDMDVTSKDRFELSNLYFYLSALECLGG
jgi:hypothetical protein